MYYIIHFTLLSLLCLGFVSGKLGNVTFFQIDIHGRWRTGKEMKYDPNTGHRIKDEAVGGRITWVHSLMKLAE